VFTRFCQLNLVTHRLHLNIVIAPITVSKIVFSLKIFKLTIFINFLFPLCVKNGINAIEVMAIQINHCKINEDTKQTKFIRVSCVPVSHSNFLVLSLVGSQQTVPKILVRALPCLTLSVNVIYIRGAQNTHTHTPIKLTNYCVYSFYCSMINFRILIQIVFGNN
jgi:hypothetical protein